MRFAVNVPNFGDFADPRAFALLARRAEQAGWDGVFVWDHILHERDRHDEIADPWILLAAAALATERVRLGAMITPVARRRPSTLARQVTTLDRLSRGRMIFGAGLGAPIDVEYGSFGEPTDPRVLAARLDEGLEALDRLWCGDAVTLYGDHVRITDVTFAPTPIQRPRPPVWIGGNWPHRRPMRRAARWDGAFPMLGNEARADPPDPTLVREVHAFLTEARADGPLAGRPFDLSVCGRDPDVAALADAGVTWWQETMPWDERLTSLNAMLARVDDAPPVSPRGTR